MSANLMSLDYYQCSRCWPSPRGCLGPHSISKPTRVKDNYGVRKVEVRVIKVWLRPKYSATKAVIVEINISSCPSEPIASLRSYKRLVR